MSYLIKYTETINPLKTIISTDILYLLLPYAELNIFIPTGFLSQSLFCKAQWQFPTFKPSPCEGTDPETRRGSNAANSNCLPTNNIAITCHQPGTSS